MGWVVKKSNKKRMNRGIHAFAFGAQERTQERPENGLCGVS